MVAVPLAPVVVDLLGVRAGDRNQIDVTLTSKGTPMNLSGLTVTAQARKKSTDPDPAITAVCTVTQASQGKLNLYWPGEDVRALLAGAATWKGVWDLQVDNGEVDGAATVAAGKWEAEQDVTRS